MIKTRLIEQVPSSKKYIALTVLAQWLKTVANIVMIFILSNLLAQILDGKAFDFKGLLPYLGAIAAVMLVRYLCGYASSQTAFFASSEVKKVLRQKMYKKLTRMGASYSEKVSTSEVIQVFVEGVDQLELYFGKYLPQFFFAMLAPITLFAVLVFVSWKASVVLLICVPLIPLSIVAVQKIAKRLLSKYWGVYTNLGDTFLENIQGLTTLKVYQADERKNVEMNEKAEEFRRITMRGLLESIRYNSTDTRLNEMNEKTDELNSLQKKLKKIEGHNISITDISIIFFSITMLLVAICLYQKGTIGFDGLIVSTVAMMSSFGPVAALSNLAGNLTHTLASGERVLSILDESPVVEENTNGDDIIFEAMECKNVGFAYDKEQILENFNMEIPKNKIIAINGPSGSGKSTALKLMMRFWDVNSGEIDMSGENIKNIKTSSLRNNQSLVSQETQLFNDTIENNIKIADYNATREEVEIAAKKASIHDFIITLPKGYDTNVGELGDLLSDGEKQRIGLARAFLCNSPMIMLDEPTSNLDSLNEGNILKSINEAKHGKSIVLVSHRKSTAKIADEAYTVYRGRLS